MNRRERIPTLHELRLAGRVERARALFGPGGYLDLPKTMPAEDLGSMARNSSRTSAGAGAGAATAVPTASQERGREKEKEDGRKGKRSENTGAENSGSIAKKGSEAGVGSGERGKEVEAIPPLPPQPQSERAEDASSKEPRQSAAPSADDNRDRRTSTAGAAGLYEGPPSGAEQHRPSAKVGQNRSTLGETQHDGVRNTSGRAGAAGGKDGTLTTVTLTVVGGRPGGRGFTDREQSGKTPSERVARFIALQAGAEGSDLLRGGLTHTVVSAFWCSASRSRVMSTWEGYWCHIISPVFFGRSVRGRHVSKAQEARRWQGQNATAAAAPANADPGPDTDTVVVPNTAAIATGSAARGLEGAVKKPGAVSAPGESSAFTNPRLMTLNEQLELAEINYQARDCLCRHQAAVLLRRKIKTKRAGGGLTGTPFPYRRIHDDEVQGWQKEIKDEEQLHRAEKRAEDIKRREERVRESRKRGQRNQLKAWLIRHLVASNKDHQDLMTKAVAAGGGDDDGDRSGGGGYAGKGAPARESSLSGRNLRPGGRFAYGQEASVEDMRKKDQMIKAQLRYEEATETLLRYGPAQACLRKQPSHPPASGGGSSSNLTPYSASIDLAIRKSVSFSAPPLRPSRSSISSTPPARRKDAAEAQAAAGNPRFGDGSGGDDGARGPCSSGGSAATDAVPPAAAAVATAAASAAASAAAEAANELPIEPTSAAVETIAQAPNGNNKPGTRGREERGRAEGRGEEAEGRRASSSRQHGDQASAADVDRSIPKTALLKILRKEGALRRKVMASDAVRPILADQDFTKGKGDIGPGSSERRSHGETFRGQKETGSGRQGIKDGLAPSDAWRRQLKVARTTNRGDGREWSRFHHHVLIRTSNDLPLYCCLCRRRKWDDARLRRIKGEHAARTSWDAILSERQEILEPMVEAVIEAALEEDRALRENDTGSWAVLRCLQSLMFAVPGRVESIGAAGEAIETTLDAVMRESVSVQERTLKRRMAALVKLRALEAYRSAEGPASRRRSRRVSVGPAGFDVTPQWGRAVQPSPIPILANSPGAPDPAKDEEGQALANRAESTAISSENTAVAAAAAATAGRLGGSQGRRRGFAEFSEQAQAIARRYYDAPRAPLVTAARAAPSWALLREIWFKKERHDGDGLNEEKALALKACGVEVLDGEREKWERQERERRGMFAQDEWQRRDDEALRRSAEAAPRETQEAGHRAFCTMIDTMERRCQSLARLRWEFTVDLGDTQRMTTRVRDAATAKRYVCRLLPCREQEEVSFLLNEAYRIQEIRNPSIVKVHSAHPHRIATYDERGVQTTGGAVVLIQEEFCSGGSLQDHLSLLLGTRSSGGGGGKRRPPSEGGSYDREVMGPRSRKVYTPEAESMLQVEEEEQKRRSARLVAAAAAAAPAAASKVGSGKVLPCPERPGTATGVFARRLELWVRQVAHGLSALHADGGLHRNISARSVYLDERGRAKLGGHQFLKGAADNSAGLRGMHEGYGCAATAPPEFELHGETSAKGDVWSLGCALYKWTTGKEFAYVAAGARLQDTLRLVPPTYPPGCIKSALFMCLQRNPVVRVSSLDLWKFMAATRDSGTSVEGARMPSTPAVAQ
ncbi:unnamed protein product [Pylaiella littoralis]